MDQIKKISKYLNRYFGVINFLNLAIMTISVIVSIFILFIASDNEIFMITSLSLNWLTLEFSESIFSNVISAKIYFVLLFLGACITLIIFLKLISSVRNILNEFVDGNIFKENMANHIMELSILSFTYGMFINVFNFINYRFIIDHSNFISLLESGKIINTQLSYTFDLSFIVLSAIIYLLSYIFRYGIELQQLSDETL